MAFSAAQYEAAIQKVNDGVRQISTKSAEVMPAATNAAGLWYIPPWMADALVAIAQRLIDIAKWLYDRIVDLLQGVSAPVMFYWYAWKWLDIKGKASGIEGITKNDALKVQRTWEGDDEEEYTKAIGPQSPAAGRIKEISESVALRLGIAATAGLAFYAALGVIIYQFIGAMTAAIAAFGSVAFSWAGVLIAVGDAGITAGMVWAAVAALIAVLASQAEAMLELKSQAVDVSTFPGGHWPKATA